MEILGTANVFYLFAPLFILIFQNEPLQIITVQVVQQQWSNNKKAEVCGNSARKKPNKILGT